MYCIGMCAAKLQLTTNMFNNQSTDCVGHVTCFRPIASITETMLPVFLNLIYNIVY